MSIDFLFLFCNFLCSGVCKLLTQSIKRQCVTCLCYWHEWYQKKCVIAFPSKLQFLPGWFKSTEKRPFNCIEFARCEPYNIISRHLATTLNILTFAKQGGHANSVEIRFGNYPTVWIWCYTCPVQMPEPLTWQVQMSKTELDFTGILQQYFKFQHIMWTQLMTIQIFIYKRLSLILEPRIY